MNRFEKYLATPKESAPMDDAIIRFPNAKGTEQIGQKKKKTIRHPPSNHDQWISQKRCNSNEPTSCSLVNGGGQKVNHKSSVTRTCRRRRKDGRTHIRRTASLRWSYVRSMSHQTAYHLTPSFQLGYYPYLSFSINF